jgi:single-stranded DNA-specific DHH superfamily exonuclease
MSMTFDVTEPADQHSGWSYYGAAHRYAVHGSDAEEAACARRTRELVAAGREADLHALAAEGDRCAAIGALEVLVDQGRVDELRAMGAAGHDPAFVTLMELFVRRGDEAALRAEADTAERARFWLSALLVRQGRVDEALAELRLLVDADVDRHAAHGKLLDLLLEHGREEEVRALAAAGDRPAIRRLNVFQARRRQV